MAPAPAPPPAAASPGLLYQARQVVAGHSHSCALVSGGAVYCWGVGAQGQLGAGSWEPSAVPVRVAGVDRATWIAGGMMHTCALLSSGRVMCWGGDHLAGTGDGSQRDRTQPALVPDLHDAVELEAADDATCARRRDGSVVCWGRNLTRRPYGPGPDRHDLPQRIEGLADVQRIAAGGMHLCAIQGARRALACIGLDHDIDPDSPGKFDDPVTVKDSGWTEVEAIATGPGVTCFRRAGERGWRCWGRNDRGQLLAAGPRSAIGAASAAPLPASENVQALAFGWEGGCLIEQGGTLSCWSEAGIGSRKRVDRIGPVQGVDTTGIRQIGHACAVDRQGAAFCWGHNGSGKLGDGGTQDQPLPVRVRAPASTLPVPLRPPPTATGTPFTADEIAAGYDETCARRGGEVWCWGRWHGRKLSDPRRIRLRPERIEGLPPAAVDIAAGFGYMCARLASGQVWCWGENTRGQLGDGTTVQHLVPVAVKGLRDATALTLSYGRGCALRATGEVFCWGGSDRTVGLAELAARRGQIAEFASGPGHACVRLRNGQVLCQGANDHGQIGNGEGGCVPDPEDHRCARGTRCRPREICARSDGFVPVGGLKDATGLSLGGGTSCALRTGGRVSCWGNGAQGRLGIGEPVASLVKTPAELPGLVDVKALSSDDSHSCAVVADGRLLCWGQNVWGEIGDRTKQNRFAPVAVHGLTGVVEVSAGMSHTCARRADRSVWCWGDNDQGLLGVGIADPISRLAMPYPVRN